MSVLPDETTKKVSSDIMCETRKAMIKANLGLDRGLTKLDQLLECTKPIAATVVRKSGKSKNAKDADESTTDFIEVPDNQSQAKALDILFTLGDYYPTKKIKADLNHSGSIMAAVANYMSNPVKEDKGQAEKSKPKASLKAEKVDKPVNKKLSTVFKRKRK